MWFQFRRAIKGKQKRERVVYEAGTSYPDGKLVKIQTQVYQDNRQMSLQAMWIPFDVLEEIYNEMKKARDKAREVTAWVAEGAKRRKEEEK